MEIKEKMLTFKSFVTDIITEMRTAPILILPLTLLLKHGNYWTFFEMYKCGIVGIKGFGSKFLCCQCKPLNQTLLTLCK